MSNVPDTAPLAALAAGAPGRTRAEQRRLEALVAGQLDTAARIIRHLGTPAQEVEDLVQQAFSVTAARLADIAPGKDRAFLIETAVRLAASAQRARARTREIATADLPEVPDGAAGPDELSDQRRALQVLDRVLDGMEHDLRTVFVLFEIEGMTMAEIAIVLQVPPGTVASRLRRAREEFSVRLRRFGYRGGATGRIG
jgi:RNA polymerase sigma-70 factor, ECF subfamily